MTAPHFDGEKLTGLGQRVEWLMKDGRWRTMRHLSMVVGGTEEDVKARLLSLKEGRFGGHTILRKHISGGVFEYRMVIGGGEDV